MFETDEQVYDCDRILSALDPQAALIFAQHRMVVTGKPITHLKHICTVGELAKIYAGIVYKASETWLESRYLLSAVECAGYLHEVIGQGTSFEEVCDISDVTVARIVASITPDIRLSNPKRNEFFSNQLGHASLEAQLIKLADMRHMSATYVKAENLPDSPKLVYSMLEFYSESTTVLPCLRKITDNNLNLGTRIKALKAELKQLNTILKPYR